MDTVRIGKGKTNHATRDGIHPLCRPEKTGRPTTEKDFDFGHVTCYSCRPIVQGYKR